jgi:hypothetical protein
VRQSLGCESAMLFLYPKTSNKRDDVAGGGAKQKLKGFWCPKYGSTYKFIIRVIAMTMPIDSALQPSDIAQSVNIAISIHIPFYMYFSAFFSKMEFSSYLLLSSSNRTLLCTTQ